MIDLRFLILPLWESGAFHGIVLHLADKWSVPLAFALVDGNAFEAFKAIVRSVDAAFKPVLVSPTSIERQQRPVSRFQVDLHWNR